MVSARFALYTEKTKYVSSNLNPDKTTDVEQQTNDLSVINKG